MFILYLKLYVNYRKHVVLYLCNINLQTFLFLLLFSFLRQCQLFKKMDLKRTTNPSAFAP